MIVGRTHRSLHVSAAIISFGGRSRSPVTPPGLGGSVSASNYYCCWFRNAIWHESSRHTCCAIVTSHPPRPSAPAINAQNTIEIITDAADCTRSRVNWKSPNYHYYYYTSSARRVPVTKSDGCTLHTFDVRATGDIPSNFQQTGDE